MYNIIGIVFKKTFGSNIIFAYEKSLWGGLWDAQSFRRGMNLIPRIHAKWPGVVACVC